jgi:hypothetical protein
MKQLIIKKTEDTPAVILIPDRGVFQLVGNSWPENPEKFYQQIINWFDEYFQNPLPETVFDFRLTYFNTASAKQIMKLLHYLKDKSSIYKVKIRWFYDSNDYESFRDAKRFRELAGIEDIMEIKEIKHITKTTE